MRIHRRSLIALRQARKCTFPEWLDFNCSRQTAVSIRLRAFGGRFHHKMTCATVRRFVSFMAFGAPIAQLDRASDYGSEGFWFNSKWVHHLFIKGFARSSLFI